LGFSVVPMVDTDRIIDDGDAQFGLIGEWNATGIGYQSSSFETSGSGGDRVAAWTFTGLDQDAWYTVAVTWPARSNLATNAPFTIRNADGTLAGQVAVNQRVTPADFEAEGVGWKQLGTYFVRGGSLTVQLANSVSSWDWVVADAVRIQQIEGDYGLDDHFDVLLGSPMIDAGDPAAEYSWFLAEPSPHGGRVNLGHTGNTAAAATSPDPLVQVLSPNGWEKLTVGRPAEITWRSAGLLDSEVVGLLNAGGTATGDWISDRYRTIAGGQASFGTAVDTTGVAEPAPKLVYQSYSYATSGVGNELAYKLPLADGVYTLRLHFAEPSYTGVGQRTFDIRLQGETVAAAYDIVADAGARYKAAAREFTVTVSDGEGLLLELVNVTSNAAILSGIEITAANPLGVAEPTVALDVSLDAGTTWTTIASGLAIDRFGRGSHTWMPDEATDGNTALVRVRGETGTEPEDMSDQAFLIASAGNHYYVNVPDDPDLTDNVFTTAAGANTFSGKSPDQPMASLVALFSAYELGPGDVVYVDTGNYRVFRNISLLPEHSGVRVEGPAAQEAAAVLDRGNPSAGSYVFRLAGATDVTLSGLELTGAHRGIFADTGAGSTGLTVSGSRIYGHADWGIWLGASNDQALLSGNRLFDQNGIYIAAADGLLVGNTLGAGGTYGIQLNQAHRTAAIDNRVYGYDTGIYAYGDQLAAANRLIVRDNTVHANRTAGGSRPAIKSWWQITRFTITRAVPARRGLR
jgi:hypothetical protein